MYFTRHTCLHREWAFFQVKRNRALSANSSNESKLYPNWNLSKPEPKDVCVFVWWCVYVCGYVWMDDPMSLCGCRHIFVLV